MALYGSNIGVNATGTLAVPLPRKFMNFFISKWSDENDSDLRYSEVPLKGKIYLSKYWWGGRPHMTTPAGQILGGGSRPLQPLRR